MFKWEKWIKNSKECNKSFQDYVDKGDIKPEDEKDNLTVSHLKKVDYNLSFINALLAQKRFYDWIIIGCYYSIYHASLALLSKEGYSSKHHSATLCALIKLYFRKDALTKEEIELVAQSFLGKEEIMYFVEAKNKRETASYGVSQEFSKRESESLKIKTILFVNKVKEILE